MRKNVANTPAAAVAYCVLGANLGRREATLRRAVFLLAQSSSIEVLRTSRIYETPPWGRTDQPPFLNAAVQLRTTLPPEALLDRFQEIEGELGRPAVWTERWGPRAADLDLALYGNQTVNTERLTVPHPRLAQRAFALIPLLEIDSAVREPATGRPYAGDLGRLGAEERESCRPWGELAMTIESVREILSGRQGETAVPQTPLRDDALLLSSASPEQTERAGEELGKGMVGGAVVALVGSLGAGKTCFARGFARGLAVAERLTSPSYVLVKSYEGRLTLHHADFYRLSGEEGATDEGDPRADGASPASLTSLGLDDCLEDPKAVVLIEWADRFPRWLEPPFWSVEIAGCGEARRMILLHWNRRRRSETQHG
ncbi:MAG TPA: 2-amino-4-hydroxy-6-hydroxymethyldihydropteridine diphosphokinase [Sumerlaeia bacterium]|nr:2-amino-4-hydroxy-6-hydroxymethyldihydropteridine diphosphokinase [Sumerlaeia bacterium]